MRIGLSLLFLTFSLLSRATAPAFHFTPRSQEAYKHIMALRLKKGNDQLTIERTLDAKNPALAFLHDYYYFLSNFIAEDPKAFDAEQKEWEKRYQVVKGGDPSSPYYRYCQAELLIHQAFLRFKFKDYVKGAANIREAYSLLKENEKKHPAFQPQYKSMGMLEVLIGTIPSSYSWLTSALGMKGNIEGGMKQISDFMNAGNLNSVDALFKDEALFLYSFLQLHVVKEKEEAWKKVEAETRDYSSNLLKCYMRASMGMHCKKTDEVIKTLTNRPTSAEYARFYFLDYLLGQAKLHRMDKDASTPLKTFVTYFKGQNYIKDAYLKIAWSYLVQGDEKQYRNYLEMVKIYGQAYFDEDKQALKEAQSGLAPLVAMLRGRLYFDGGYYEKALLELNSITANQFRNAREKTEHVYRLGRVYDEKGDKEKALEYYQKTLDLAKSQPWYYAANASLHMGYIYEKKGDKVKAKSCFEAVLTMPVEEYKTSLEGKAKAALQKLKESD